MSLDPNPGNGGHAFPQSGSGPFGSFVTEGGMSLRDWFAGQALMGIIGSDGGKDNAAYFGYAREAYCFADAMLKAREAQS